MLLALPATGGHVVETGSAIFDPAVGVGYRGGSEALFNGLEFFGGGRVMPWWWYLILVLFVAMIAAFIIVRKKQQQ